MKKISIFIRKFENKNKPTDTMIPSRNKFYINLMYYLQELGHEVLIYDQSLYEKKMSNSNFDWIKKKLNSKIFKKPNFPFFSKKLTKSDYEFFEHTISNNRSHNIINIKPFYIPGHYYFDKKGFSAWSEISSLNASTILKSNANSDLFFKEYYNNIVLNNLSKYFQPDKQVSNLPRNFFFLPLQLVDDTVNTFCDHSTLDFLKKFINIFSTSSEYLIIKRHPKCKSTKIEKILNNINFKNILVLNASIHDLISKCKAVIVNNSGVGFEALFHLKPVYVFGKSDYNIVCRSILINEFNPTKVKPLIANEITMIKSFIFNVLNEYIVKTDDKSSFLKAFRRIGLYS